MKDVKDLYKDELTGVLSRRYLNLIVSREIERSKRYNERFAVMILDIDDFKLINDTYGHQKGDSALVIFADTLKKTLRASDSIIRYGGDEFVVIMPKTGIEEARKAASRIVNALKERKSRDIYLSASIGIGVYPDNGETWEEVFRAADRALYESKRLGKGRYEVAGKGIRGLSIPTKSIIGRRKERSELAHKIDEAGKLHLVVGETGIGKTRLVVDTIKSAGCESIYARSIGTVGEMPYHLIRETIKDAIKKYRTEVFLSYDSMPDVFKEEIRKIVPEVFRGEVTSSEGGDKYRLYEAVLHLLSHIKEDALLIVIDDLQWIDEGSMEFISYILHMMPEKFVIIGIERKEDIEKSPVSDTLRYLGRLNLYDVLELGPLSKAETHMMLQAALGLEVEDNIVNIIYEKSGGNPLFIEEIIKDLYHSNSIKLDNDVYVLKEGVRISPPLNIEDVVKDKIKAMGDRERQIIELAAIIGRKVDPFLVSKSSGINEGEVFDALDKAVKLQLMSESSEDTSYIFSEGIVRDTILEGISKGKRQYYHKKVAEVLKDMYKDNIEEVVEDIIYHYDEAGLKDKADKYCRVAGDKFYRLYAYERAGSYYRRIIDKLKSKKDAKYIINNLYKVHRFVGKYEDFMPIAKKVLKMFPELSGSIYTYIADLYSVEGIYDSAIDAFERGIKSVQNPIEAQGLKVDLAWIVAHKGDTQKARSILQNAIAFFKKELNQIRTSFENKKDIIYSNLASAYSTLGATYYNEKKPEKAIEYLEKAIEYEREKEDVLYQNLAIFYVDIAMAYLDMKDIHSAFEYLNLAKNIIEKSPSPHINAFIDQILGETNMRIGELDVAEEFFKTSLRKNRAIKNYLRIVGVTLDIANVYLMRRKFSYGLKLLNDVEDISHEIGYREYVLDMLFNRFRNHLYSGSIVECKKDIEDLKKEAGNDERYIHYVLEAEGEFFNETGEYNKAISRYEKLLEKGPDGVSYLLGLAKAYAGSKNMEKAREVLEKAERLNEGEKIAFQRMQNEFHIGEVYYMMGEQNKAINIFKRIYPEFKKRGIHLYTHKMDKYLYSS